MSISSFQMIVCACLWKTLETGRTPWVEEKHVEVFFVLPKPHEPDQHHQIAGQQQAR